MRTDGLPVIADEIYVARPPRGRLGRVVSHVWRIEAPPSDSGDVICPDGTTELVLHLGDPMIERREGVHRTQPRYLLVGQMDRPLTLEPTGRSVMVGARFKAGALFHLLPLPQDRLAGHILDASDIWEVWTARTASRIAAVATARAQLDAFETALEELTPAETDTGRDPLEAAVRCLRKSGGRAGIGWLADRAGVSRRQFERRFRERVGLSPRLYGRIVRFQRAFSRLGQASGADIAAHCGYADQAHLVREVRRFAGTVPSALADAEGWTRFFQSGGA